MIRRETTRSHSPAILRRGTAHLRPAELPAARTTDLFSSRRSSSAPAQHDAAAVYMGDLKQAPAGRFFEFAFGKLMDATKQREFKWRFASNTAGVFVALATLARFVLPEIGVNVAKVSDILVNFKNTGPFNVMDMVILSTVGGWFFLFNRFRAIRDVFTTLKDENLSEFEGPFFKQRIDFVVPESNDDGARSEIHYRDVLEDQQERTRSRMNGWQQKSVLLAVAMAAPGVTYAFFAGQAPFLGGAIMIAYFASVCLGRSLSYRTCHSDFEKIDLHHSLR